MSLLGDRLRQARKKKGFTQDYTAKIIGSTYQTISNYERGERDPDTETLARLANLYEVPVGWLVGQIDDPAPPQPKREKPNHEQYVLSALTLPDALLRIAEVQAVYDIDDTTFIELSKKAIEKFGVPKSTSGRGAHAAHVVNSIPGTGVFEGDNDI